MGSSALQCACFMGFDKVVDLLIKHKADVNLQKDGTTPLFYACEFGTPNSKQRRFFRNKQKQWNVSARHCYKKWPFRNCFFAYEKG